MKQLFFIFILLVGSVLAHGQVDIEDDTTIAPFYVQMDSIFREVDRNRMQTNYLLEKSLVVADPANYRTDEDSSVDAFLWQGMYHTFLVAHEHDTNDLELWDSLEVEIEDYRLLNVIPIGMLLFEFDRIKPNAVGSELLLVDSTYGKYLKDGNETISPFFRDSCFFAAPLKTYTDTGVVTFVVPSRLFKSHYAGAIETIEIDFDDGEGWQMITLDLPITISYEDEGVKTLKYRITTSNGTFGGSTKFKNRMLFKRYTDRDPLTTFTLWDFEAEEEYLGKKARAHVTISYGCGDGKLRKPLIVVPGFDPPEFVDLTGEEMQDYWDFVDNLDEDFRTKIENEGYDLIYINYHNGSDYIQRNAELVESVIRWVNAEKAVNGSDFPNTVLGISMGGLVLRYALGEMEEDMEMHDVETYYSMDSPHNGANIPLSFQVGVTHVKGISIYVYLSIGPFGVPIPLSNFVEEINLVEGIIGSFAALQMLENHHYASSLYGRTSFRDALITQLNAFGMPVQVSTRGRQIRNIAISNGTDEAIDQGFAANAKLLEFEISGGLFTPPPFALPKLLKLESLWAKAEFWAIPNHAQGKKLIYEGHYWARVNVAGILGGLVLSNYKFRFDNPNTDALDNAPGGFIDLSTFQIPAIPGLTIHQPRFCFVPSVSSAALVAPYNEDLYYNLHDVWNASTHTWQNGESPMDKYTISEIDIVSGFANNTGHTVWFDPSRNFFIDNLLPLPNGIPENPLILSTTVHFNFGEGTSDRAMYVEIGSGGFLNINADEPLGLADPTSSNPAPDNGSHFITYITGANCFEDAVGVDILNSGTVQVGDNSTDNTADLIFTAGTYLEIQGGGKLIIADNSRVIIEEGATLYFNPNAIIQLEGENAVLEIRGRLEIGNGAQFTFTKGAASTGGFVRWAVSGLTSPNIFPSGTGASFYLEGADKEDKILEIQSNSSMLAAHSLVSSNYFATFGLKNGLVEFINGGQILTGSVLTLDEVLFKGSGNSEMGINMLGQAHIIDNCEFRDLGKGIYAELDHYGNSLTLSNCLFKNCDNGLFVSGEAILLDNCNFILSEDQAVVHVEATEASELINCDFWGNSTGLAIDYSDQHTNISGCWFLENGTGISISDENALVTISCTPFELCDVGIVNFGHLNMSPELVFSGVSDIGGYNSFSFNTYGISLIEGALYIKNGENNFYSSTPTSPPHNFITGTIKHQCACIVNSTEIEAVGNFWNPDPPSSDISNGVSDFYSLEVFQTWSWVTAELTGSTQSAFNEECYYFPRIYPNYKKPVDEPERLFSDSELSDFPDKITHFPNPSSGSLTIMFSSEVVGGSYKVRIFDVLGKEVYSNESYVPNDGGQIKLDLSLLVDGVYYVSIKGENLSENRTIIINKN